MAVQVKTLKKDSVVNIAIGSGYYEKLKNEFLLLVKLEDTKDLKEIIKQVINKNPAEPLTFNQTLLQTYVLLLASIEAEIEKQGLFEVSTIPEESDPEFAEWLETQKTKNNSIKPITEE